MTQRYELVDADGAVVNIIQWDGVSPYNPGDGLVLRILPEAEPTPPSIDDERLRATAAIKLECQRRILLLADETKQRNMLARASELVLAHSMGVLTDAEALEMAQLQAIWARIKALRLASNALEASLDALNYEQLALYDPASKAWPE